MPLLHAGVRLHRTAGRVHHWLLDHAAEAQSDVFELLRGRSGTAQGCLVEALGIFAKLPSGYQRDLQLLKSPLFRGIDLAAASLAILPPAIDAMHFRAEKIRLDEAIHAAEEANEMVVREGIPFREAYRRVGAKLRESSDE